MSAETLRSVLVYQIDAEKELFDEALNTRANRKNMSNTRLTESDITNEGAEEFFSALSGLFPAEIVNAFGQDLAEAISALSGCWTSDTESFQRLIDGWKKEAELLASGLDVALENGTEVFAKQFSEIANWKTINDDFLVQVIDKAPGLSPRYGRLLQFARRQLMSMTDPKNSVAGNAEVLQRLADTDGASLRKGVEHLQQDIAEGLNDFQIKRCAENAFRLGEDIAATEGVVIFQNELIQLIHYRPTQADVTSTPMLFVPPCINKYYILDLTRELSVVGWLVSQGIDLYMISWANPDEESDDLGLTDYVEKGVEAAKSFILSQADTEQVHVAGYCIGGLFAALAAADTDQNGNIASLTLLNTLLDYQNPGELEVFLSERLLSALTSRAEQEGFLRGNLLSWAFTLLKERQLLWPYLVRRYMLGEELPKDPVMYWNQDVANLQAKMMGEYLRNLYLENRFWTGDKSVVEEKPLFLKDISVPTYLLACTKDHIVDWKRALAASKKLSGDTRMVLAAGGHVMGVLSSAERENRSRYWVLGESGKEGGRGRDKEGSKARSKEELSLPEMEQSNSGSWWGDWINWLNGLDGHRQKAVDWNSEQEKSIEKAPGSYVNS